MAQKARSPAELRNMLGANLRKLSQGHVSISELSRQLGINRTQFNRYLAGESFPRPDVLDRICEFFGVDARILLEPVENLSHRADPLNSPVLRDFVGAGISEIPEAEFPGGFYRFYRRSFIDQNQFVVGLVYVFRKGRNTYVRGFEAREAMRQQGLPTNLANREFRGIVMRQEDGIAAIISRRQALTASFNYLSRVPSFENNFWLGYVVRSVRESVTGNRAVRMVYEHIGLETGNVLKAARSTGFISEDELLPFHRRLLEPETPFR